MWFEDHHNFHQAREKDSPALVAAAGWWRRGAQQKSRGSARCGSRPERLRLICGPRTASPPQAASRAGRSATWGSSDAATSGSPAGGLQFPLPQLLLLPLSSSLLAADKEKSPRGRRRILGEDLLGRFLIGRRLGFRGTGAGGRDPSASALLATRRYQGGAARARRKARRSLSRRPCVTMGNDRGRGKRWGIEELTGGPHMAVKHGGGWW
jgi:hypothetical protein